VKSERLVKKTAEGSGQATGALGVRVPLTLVAVAVRQ
jgi:hypothetical protein